MKYELLKHMLLEEIRLHSELRGSRNFFLFPLILAIITAFITYFMVGYSTIGTSVTAASVFIVVFFAFGVISGTFGLHATDYLERRFGDYGRLFSNSLVLPIKLSNIFLMAALSDSIFYFGWFILPIIGGFALGSLLIGASLIKIPLLLLTATLSFIFGISISFFLSVLVTKSIKIFYAMLFFITIISVLGFGKFHMDFFLPYHLYANFGFANLIFNILIISILFFSTAKIIGNEYNTIRAKGKYKSFQFKSVNHFLFKDYIDLRRTHGLIAKPLFNVVIPSVLMILLLSSITVLQIGLSSVTNNLIFVAILLGTLSISFFNVLLSGDSFDYYIFLPASIKNFILPKIVLSQIICSVQGIILLIIYATINSTYQNLGASILLLIAFIFYTMSISFYINGLKPNENSMNITSLAWMMLLFMPVILAGMIIPFVFSYFYVYLVFALFLLLAGKSFYKKGIKRWTRILMN